MSRPKGLIIFSARIGLNYSYPKLLSDLSDHLPILAQFTLRISRPIVKREIILERRHIKTSGLEKFARTLGEKN